MKIADLRQKRAKLRAKAEKLLDAADRRGGSWTDSSDKREYDRRMEEIQDLTDRIEDRERLRDHERRSVADGESRSVADGGPRAGRPAVGGGESRNELDPDPLVFRTEDGEEIRTLGPGESLADRTEPAGQASLGRIVRAAATADRSGLTEMEERALDGGDVGGGYLVPEPLAAQVIDLARAQTVLKRAGARTLPMPSKSLDLARVDAGPTAVWKQPNASITESEPSFGQITLRAKTLTGMVRMPVELVEDAQNIEGLLESELAKTLGLELDRAALRGDGAGAEPTGIRFLDDVQLTDLGSTAAVYDDLSEAAEAVWSENGEPNAVIWSPAQAGKADRMKDGDGKWIGPSPAVERLNFFRSNQIPEDLGGSNDETEIYVGDFRQVILGARTNLRLEVSREASDAFENLQVLVRAYLRADVHVEHPKHIHVHHGVTV